MKAAMSVRSGLGFQMKKGLNPPFGITKGISHASRVEINGLSQVIAENSHQTGLFVCTWVHSAVYQIWTQVFLNLVP